ncbi:Acyl-CoA dehydrogenase [Actinokineospora alba]|uniref:Acyl-CoA dehydrogenase n=1 Tax=Actinokineospora alba TaxID=504798 RepID=A0A1H0R6B9_9PSEU|nr:acyl-CoA dehydrogenase family protein [Actinokineospora alba]TDP70227.1 alkylation response protein AidB-like acyl-CoA dehydrogenase [Actinokineospora alba]SDI36387.1 Acyl-CoA dehydrogenase [Actinokineospora alba]SDP25092.1 Acyl-CoA dehydrogenase [Actinokineospora alba]
MIQWTQEQRDLRAGLAPWCEALSADHVERDADAEFPWDKWKLIQECGILRLPFDPEWGGLGLDLLTTMYLLEGLGAGCRDGGLNFSVSTHMVSAGVPLQRFGTAEQKRAHLTRICSGAAIGAHAISEPDSGSDALAMRTSAVRDGDDFVLNGSKTFVSNGPIAGMFIVYARTHPLGGPLGTTAFLVERDTPGFTVGKPISKMGLRTSPLCELFFDDCRVPAANVIGKPGGGFLVLNHVMKWEVLCSFAINLGEMVHRLERCVRYASERVQFGQPIGAYQAVSHQIVEMKMGVETTRKWLYDTATRLTRGENVTVDMAITKLVASESNVASAMAAVRLFGGNGYMSEYGLEKDLRNAVAGTIYSGTSEIQRNRIASMIGVTK